jgi:hypothetical protein
MSSDVEFKLTSIQPCYDYDKVGGGHFKLFFGVSGEMPYTLGFTSFLERRLRDDDALFDYIKKHHRDKTVSHAIHDLYDMGFPVDSWVHDYIEVAREDVDPKMFNALLNFYKYIKDFGEPSGSL